MLTWAIDMIVLDIKPGVAIRTIDMFDIVRLTIHQIIAGWLIRATMNVIPIQVKMSFCLFSKYLPISYLMPGVH